DRDLVRRSAAGGGGGSALGAGLLRATAAGYWEGVRRGGRRADLAARSHTTNVRRGAAGCPAREAANLPISRVLPRAIRSRGSDRNPPRPPRSADVAGAGLTAT